MSKVPFAFIIVRKGFAPALSGPADGGLLLPAVIQTESKVFVKFPYGSLIRWPTARWPMPPVFGRAMTSR
jgi:hypothetical protein